MKLSEKWYLRVKWLVIIVLPAFSALYFGLSEQWNLPAAEQVVGSVAVITAFLGTILGVSTSNYQPEGVITVGLDDDGFPELKDIDMSGISAEEIGRKKQVVLKVAA